jgi:hypothetical protein
MSELFFATKKSKDAYGASSSNTVKFVEDRTGAALAIAEGWRVYKLEAVECFQPDITFSDKAPAKAIEAKV